MSRGMGCKEDLLEMQCPCGWARPRLLGHPRAVGVHLSPLLSRIRRFELHSMNPSLH